MTNLRLGSCRRIAGVVESGHQIVVFAHFLQIQCMGLPVNMMAEDTIEFRNDQLREKLLVTAIRNHGKKRILQ